MFEYPAESHFKHWEITENGEEVHIRIMNKNSADTFMTYPYRAMRHVLWMTWNSLVQAIAIRVIAKQPVATDADTLQAVPMAVTATRAYTGEGQLFVIVENILPNGLIVPMTLAPVLAQQLVTELTRCLQQCQKPIRH